MAGKKEDFRFDIPPTARVIMMDTPITTVPDFARRSGMTESAVRGYIARGELPTYRMKEGGKVMINIAKLAELALNKEH